MGFPQQNEGQQLPELVQEWALSEAAEFPPEVAQGLVRLVRAEIGELLLSQGIESEIDFVKAAGRVVEVVGSNLTADKKQELESKLLTLFRKTISYDGPTKFTRWLWMWDPANDLSCPVVENELFRLISVEMRGQIYKHLHSPRFTRLKHKIDQAELVSELYIRLKKSKVPFLPANRWQFCALVDRVIQSILIDMVKHSARDKRPQTQKRDPLLDVHADFRHSNDPLQVLLDSEDPEGHAEQRLKVYALLEGLSSREQKVISLKTNGATIEEIAKELSCSRATVIRDAKTVKEFLIQALKSQDVTPPA